MMVKLGKIRETDAELAKQVAEQIFDNALVAAGLMEDPRAMLAPDEYAARAGAGVIRTGFPPTKPRTHEP